VSDENCGNCGAPTENEPLVLCDECNDPEVRMSVETYNASLAQVATLAREVETLKAELAKVTSERDALVAEAKEKEVAFARAIFTAHCDVKRAVQSRDEEMNAAIANEKRADAALALVKELVEASEITESIEYYMAIENPKPEAEWDEYDAMILPRWKKFAEVLARAHAFMEKKDGET
jgi:hypothetical protein